MPQSVSCVIPARDVETTIGRAIESALAQRLPEGDVEVVVVDNGSRDATPSVVRRYPVRLVHEARRGRSAARNRGAAESRGDVLAFLDADCEAPQQWVDACLKCLSEPWIGAAQARVQRSGAPATSAEFVQAHYHLPFLDTCALVTTRAAFDAVHGYDEELRRTVDMDFSFRLLACGYALAWVPSQVVLKHHDLTHRQAARRGWDGGLSLSLLNRKWRERLRASSGKLLVDRFAGWARVLGADARRLQSTGGLRAVEDTTKLLGYLAGELTPGGCSPQSFAPVTAMRQVLGDDRYLVVLEGGGLVFDAVARRVERLDAVRVSELARALRERLAAAGMKP